LSLPKINGFIDVKFDKISNLKLDKLKTKASSNEDKKENESNQLSFSNFEIAMLKIYELYNCLICCKIDNDKINLYKKLKFEFQKILDIKSYIKYNDRVTELLNYIEIKNSE